MLSEHENAAFNDIAAGIGRLEEPKPPYLMPWWMPPSVVLFYGLLMAVAGAIYWTAPLTVSGIILVAVAGRWARHRRPQRSGYRPELSHLRPFIR